VFLRNMLPPSSCLKSKPTKKTSRSRLSLNYTALQARILSSSSHCHENLKTRSFEFVSREFSALYLAGTLSRHNSIPVGYYRYKCDDDGYFRVHRLRRTQKTKQSPPHATQPLCGSSRYNLRQVTGILRSQSQSMKMTQDVRGIRRQHSHLLKKLDSHMTVLFKVS
jgi:hypothetical protein